MTDENHQRGSDGEDYVAGGRHSWGDFVGGFAFGAIFGLAATYDFIQTWRGIAATALLSGLGAGAVFSYCGRELWDWIRHQLPRR